MRSSWKALILVNLLEELYVKNAKQPNATAQLPLKMLKTVKK
jgi:hypothetical protein